MLSIYLIHRRRLSCTLAPPAIPSPRAPLVAYCAARSTSHASTLCRHGAPLRRPLGAMPAMSAFNNPKTNPTKTTQKPTQQKQPQNQHQDQPKTNPRPALPTHRSSLAPWFVRSAPCSARYARSRNGATADCPRLSAFALPSHIDHRLPPISHAARPRSSALLPAPLAMLAPATEQPRTAEDLPIGRLIGDYPKARILHFISYPRANHAARKYILRI